MIKPCKIVVKGMAHEPLLISAGYRNKGEKGWTFKLDKTHRYHIYYTGKNKHGYDQLELHTDLIKKNPIDGKFYHVASTYLGKEERKRLKRLMPPVPHLYPRELTEKQKKALQLKLLNSSVDKETINKSIEEAYRKTKEYLK